MAIIFSGGGGELHTLSKLISERSFSFSFKNKDWVINLMYELYLHFEDNKQVTFVTSWSLVFSFFIFTIYSIRCLWFLWPTSLPFSSERWSTCLRRTSTSCQPRRTEYQFTVHLTSHIQLSHGCKHPTPGVGNFDDGEGHYIFTYTPRGHYAYRVKNI